MDKFPGPVHADHEAEAEQRRRALKQRFHSVSRGLDRGRLFRTGGAASGTGFSPFEIAIGVGGALFVVWVAARFLGLG
jgi:hypothetical protein